MEKDPSVKAGLDEQYLLKDIIAHTKTYIAYLKLHIVIIYGVIIIGAVVGFLYAYLTKPIYVAKLNFAIEDDKSSGGLGAAAGLASQFGFDLGTGGGGVFSGDNLLELLKSRRMVEGALLSTVKVNGKDETLADFYIDFKKLRQKWSGNVQLNKIRYLPGADRKRFTLTQDSVLGLIYKDITNKNLSVAKEDKKLSIITVQLNADNELFAKYFSEVLVEKVSDFYRDIKTKKSAQNVAILQHQADSVRKELHNNMYGVASSVDNVPNANPALQILKVPSQHRQIDVQANTAILGELVKNLELAKIALRKETPLVQVIDSPTLPLDIEKFGKIKTAIIGGLIGAFLSVVILVIIKWYKNLVS